MVKKQIVDLILGMVGQIYKCVTNGIKPEKILGDEMNLRQESELCVRTHEGWCSRRGGSLAVECIVSTCVQKLSVY